MGPSWDMVQYGSRLAKAKLSQFFYIFARNHPSTSVMHPGGEIEGWNPCTVACDIRSFQKVLLKIKKKTMDVAWICKGTGSLNTLLHGSGSLNTLLHGSGSELETSSERFCHVARLKMTHQSAVPIIKIIFQTSIQS